MFRHRIVQTGGRDGTTRRRIVRVALPAASVLAIATLVTATNIPTHTALSPRPHLFNRHAADLPTRAEKNGNGGEASRQASASFAQEQYDNLAYPAAAVAPAQQQDAYQAFLSIDRIPGGKSANWQPVGPSTQNVPGAVTYTGAPTVNSGRVTALAVSPSCQASSCQLLLGAAGGGVWKADNALAPQPNWHPSGDGIPSNAIGSILFDPNDKSGQTVYAGTGEPNGSSDSEAGVGLYKSTDAGHSWSLVAGSVKVARDRSIGAIAVDPTNPNHIYIGTDVARHGSSSENGGRFTPPGAPPVGLYESTDGGATFSLAFSVPSDTVIAGTPTGLDYFRGGVTKIELDRTGLAASQPTSVYASVFDYGLYRSSPADEGGDAAYKQVFASAGGGSPANSAGARTEFALAPNGNSLRIYVGDTDGSKPANLYRVDNANVPAQTLNAGGTNGGWTKLSSATKGTPGFASYDFCGGQCSYDMPVASPAGHPNTVWIGGQMQYGEIFTAHQPSNGRAVQRSTDAGASFTDMTNDAETTPVGMHPDQHVIAFDPSNPDIAFIGSDGGLVRTGGDFTDASSSCDSRGLSGADLADCKAWLSSIPTRIFSLNDGLSTLQFQSVSVNPQSPLNDVMGGTQDNGTWSYTSKGNGTGAGNANLFETVGGDGGQSGIDAANANIRVHTYYGQQTDTNFQGTNPLGWDWTADPFFASGEAASFYIPLITDPRVGGTMFAGLQHVWRTQDSGGSQAYLDRHCNEYTGDFTVSCGDWVRLGGGTLTGSAYGSDKGGSYVVQTQRAPSDTGTLWTATRRGRLFVSTNADAAAASVRFTRIDTASQPTRFISGIAVDPSNPNHAFVSYSGYNAYTPSTPGHVFDVTYNPATGTATWNDLSHNLGDLPATGIAYDNVTGDLYVSTDFGVVELASGSTTWAPAAGSLPPVTVYGLTIAPQGRILYAATHGRGMWKLAL